jgi:hypothetical protein
VSISFVSLTYEFPQCTIGLPTNLYILSGVLLSESY